MNAPNNYRQQLFAMAMECFSRRHAENKVERRNVRDKLQSFFSHGKVWRLWRDGKLPKRKF